MDSPRKWGGRHTDGAQEPEWIPSLEQIEEAKAEIRRGWTRHQELRRRGLTVERLRELRDGVREPKPHRVHLDDD